jgi:methionyl-tRNA formyltransferase
MRCASTEPVVAALLAAPEIDLMAVVLPESPESIPESAPGPVVDAARSGKVALIGLPNRATFGSPAFRSVLEAIAPDAIVVACFPWRLPEWLLALPTRCCLNVHPSLLPDGRGPEPIFWAFRWGLVETGVTIHVMDSGFDTGPIVTQRTVTIPGAATIGSLEGMLANIGANLLIDCLTAWLNGSAVASVQEGGQSRYASAPGPEDMVVPTTWSAPRAARFIRAVSSSHGPVSVAVYDTGQRLAVDEVVDTIDHPTMAEAVRFQGLDAHIRFSPGVLICQLATHSHPLRFHGNVPDRSEA